MAGQTQNLILRELARQSPATFAAFLEVLEPVALERGAIIGTARSRADCAYFIESGIVSLVASTHGGQSLEVALVGREGVAGISDALGQHPLPYAWVVQLAGLAYRAPADVVRYHLASCTELHDLLMAYSQLLMHQLVQSALCNRFHSSVQRLARWLVLTAERAGTDRLELTHEFMAQMVGAPRSAVTQAASALREKGIIDYRRGVLAIRNMKRLQKTACECAVSVSAVLIRNGNSTVEGNGAELTDRRRRTTNN